MGGRWTEGRVKERYGPKYARAEGLAREVRSPGICTWYTVMRKLHPTEES